LVSSHTFGDDQAESMRPPDSLDDLLVSDPVRGHRRQKALFDNTEIDLASVEFDTGEVALCAISIVLRGCASPYSTMRSSAAGSTPQSSAWKRLCKPSNHASGSIGRRSWKPPDW
jgi:hypothetical protein